MFRNLFLIGAVLCAFATPSSAAIFDWGSLLTTTHNGFVAADKDAKDHSDAAASQCYEGADAYLQTQSGTASGFVSPGPVTDAITLFQSTRDVVKFSLSTASAFKTAGIIPAPLKQACSWLFVDSLGDVRQVAADVTSIAAKVSNPLGLLNLVIAGHPVF